MTAAAKVACGTLVVLIARDITSVVPKTIRPWELPIVQLKYPGQVSVGDFTAREIAEYPDEEAEYERLTQVYGADEDSKQPFVTLAYGAGDAGLDALEKAIKDSAEAPKPREARKSSRAAAKAEAADKPKAAAGK